MEIEQVLFDRFLVDGAIARGIETLGRVRAPPHPSTLRIGTAEAVTEETALPEGGLDPRSDSGVLDEGSRHKTAKADQSGVKRPWPVRQDLLTYHRMHAIGADDEVALGAAAVGEMRDDRPVGSILDARQRVFETHRDTLTT